jgi:hypothetical protein
MLIPYSLVEDQREEANHKANVHLAKAKGAG